MNPRFEAGDIFDNKYEVTGVCSDAGGMGTILFVTPLASKETNKVVLKYCKVNDEEELKRFRREVRLLGSFKGNSKIVQVIDENLDHDPPYFVMRYYPDGDLSGRVDALRASYGSQESCFLQIIDCLQELHARQVFHRDIKPQNFLLEGDQIVVSDLGLTTEIGSNTGFTRSSAWWGTHGYIPPEFFSGGFKHADASGDVFMVGKTIYTLLTGRDPTYIESTDVPPPLLHIIERCCNVSKQLRYQSLAQLKQSLVAAYDVLLGRAGGFGKTKQLFSAIEDRLSQESNYRASEIAAFVEQLALPEEDDQIRICRELPPQFFAIIGQVSLADNLPRFLTIYEKLVGCKDYSWGYAETIADNMRAVFERQSVPPADRARALDLAIRAAYYKNRFAAMDTCRSFITSIDQEDLGFHVAPILARNKVTFVADIEISECQTDAIRNALRQIKEERQG